MSAEDDPTKRALGKFSVIHGSAQLASGRPAAPGHLVSVARESVRVEIQLGLPGIHELQTGLISISFSKLLDVGIEPVIRHWFPRYVVDLRVAPTFYPITSRVAEFARMLENDGVRYLHDREISNRFAGDAWHPELLRDRFIHQLRQSGHVLEEISRWAMEGRVLVISADPQTHGSDREIFADEIRRVSAAVSWQEIS